MGKRIQEDQKVIKRDRQDERANNKATRKNKAGRKQQQKAPEPIVADLLKILIEHFFPNLNEEINNFFDPRSKDKIIYSKEHLFYLGLSMFLFHYGSRNQLENERKSIHFYNNLLVLSETDEDNVATMGAMNYFMQKMDPSNGLELLPGKMVSTLIRSRVLERFRNSYGEYMVALDGVHLFTKKGVHENSTKKEINGEIYSYYYALEAKLVTEDGFGLSFATVFIETDKEFDKEDCELNAFYRLEKIIKKRFPKLQICLLLDGLYANKNVIDICHKNQWGYIMSFKEGSLPKAHKVAMEEINKNKDFSIDHSPNNGVYQHLSWGLNIKHKERAFHVIKCEETQITKCEVTKKTFFWLMNTMPNKNNVAQLAKEARCRWVVEEAFNIQKNGGYELTHNYGTVGFAMKNYYYLLQIAHILHQLLIRSDLFLKLQKKFILHRFRLLPDKIKVFILAMAKTTREHFRTIKNFVKRLGESFRNQYISEFATDIKILGRIQIRFDSS